jgi:hypothetical protein
MTKEDFLVKKSDSSTSSSSDQQKKLSKKQAKKLAKKNQTTNTDNEKLEKKISNITLQPTFEEGKPDDSAKNISDEKDDKLPEMPKVVPNPSIYRRHMSESQVNLEAVSNGEFKLKVYHIYFFDYIHNNICLTFFLCFLRTYDMSIDHQLLFFISYFRVY